MFSNIFSTRKEDEKLYTKFMMEGLFACKRLQKTDQFNLL